MKDILDLWPFSYPPRENQKRALEWLAEQDKKYLLLEAPVGTGKSNIGVTYSRYLTDGGNSFILTPQRILQEQYENSFRDNRDVNMASFYGKSNYSCQPKNTSCDIGSLVKPQCPNCPFKAAKKRAQSANDTVLNYKLALTSFAFTPTFKPRKLIILDECHTVEDHLVGFDALQITEWRCKKYNVNFVIQRTLRSAIEWMKEYYIPAMGKALKKLEDECEPLMDKSGTELTNSDIRKLKELNGLQDHLDETATMSFRTEEYIADNFVLVHDKQMFQFKRLTGAYSFKKILEPMAEQFMFMSSTILDREGFCSDLGIAQEDAAFLSLPSEFDPEKRPVFYMPQMKMNAKWKLPENQAGRNAMLQTVHKLLGMHKEESGIIHTGNFEIAQWLVENLNTTHKIYHHNPDVGDDRNSVIAAFQGDPKPSVLISPSITEGLDLKEDLGRFAIITKVPFGFLGDQWIKRRLEMSEQWYQRRALIDIIQGGGRIVRSENDWGNVYILDQSWNFLSNKVRYMIPQWWRDSYKVV